MLANTELDRRDDTRAVWGGEKAICKHRIVWLEKLMTSTRI